MKAFVKLMTVIVMLSFLAGCTAPATPPPAATEPPAPAATEPPAPAATEAPQPAPTEPPAQPALSPAEEWAKANEVGPYQAATLDWAAIEEAAKKEGKVVVYANTSRIEDEIELFKAKYPDIVLEGYDVDDIATKMAEEQKAGNVVGDVWFNSDGSILFGEFVPKQWLWPFIPDTMREFMPTTEDQPFAIARYGVRALGYNTELNPDGCPVTNWWQLTEPAYKGKVFIEDPLDDVSTMAILTEITQHGDEMAAAYKELYGKDPTLEEDTPNAAWLWLKMFAKNSPVPEPGGDEVVQAFASPGMTEAGVGFTSYSKYRDTLKGELVFDVCKDAKPVMGVKTATYLAIATNAQHPNAAKLFINFVLGDEGRAPWAVIGDYPALTNQTAPEGAIPMGELSVWAMNDAFIYANISQVRDFWTINFLTP